jgi:hypothetical protein
VWLGLLGALAASLFLGTGTVLEAMAARTEPLRDRKLDPGLLTRLLRRWHFVGGLACELVGFLCLLGALRTLPLFLAQSSSAGSLAVSAVLGSKMIGYQLHKLEKAAVIAVCAGLALLGVSAAGRAHVEGGWEVRTGLIIAVGVLVVLALAAAKLPPGWRAGALGGVAGLAFGVASISIRVLGNLHSVKSLAEDPAFYVMCVCGAGAFLLFATALQQSKVTVVQSAMVLGQTVIPAIVGVLVLGDRPRHGFMIVALVGFLCAIGGALVLARFEAREDTVAQARRKVEKDLAEETAEGTANADAALGQTGPPPAIEDRKPPAAGGAALGRRRIAHGEPDTPPASR